MKRNDEIRVGDNDEPTTVHRPRLQATPSGSDNTDSSTTGVENAVGNSSNSNSAQFRSSRSWTFSSGNRRQHQLFVAATDPDSAYADRGLNWTPPPPSTSPHPLGYYSDSPPPAFHSIRSTSAATGGTSSPLLQSKMVLQDSDDHTALAPPISSAHLNAHRSSIGGGGASSQGRRFSTSLHHPHCYIPLAQQLHHNHLLMQQQQQQSVFVTAPPGTSGHQRRRDSATAFAILPTGAMWDTPSGSTSNLHRLRRGNLGHSCPQLSSLVNQPSTINLVSTSGAGQGHYRGGAGPAVKLRRDIAIQRRHSHRMSRRSFHANTSPILNAAMAAGAGASAAACQFCRSPLRQGSPVLSAEASPGRPCPHHVHPQPAIGPSHRRNSLRVQYQDARRWSVASLPSSGYGTPGSSAMSSQYSSQERLVAAMEEQRCQRYGSNDSNPPYCPPDNNQRLGIFDRLPRMRSRSLSSIAWLNLSSSRLDNSSVKVGEENVEVALRNNVYKERFPKAKRQMEEKLETFLADNSLLSSSETNSSYQLAALSSSYSDSAASNGVQGQGQSGGGSGTNLVVPGNASPRRTSLTPPVIAADAESLKLLSDGSARFIHHQIMELAMDCLQKSKSDSLSSAYFYELSQNLEELLEEAKDKAVPEAVEQLSALVKKLLIIVSRPARLLECLEFDPEEFYRLLHEAEGHAKEAQRQGMGVDVPQYIIRQLGLNRCGPLQDLSNCLTQSTDSGNVADTPTHAATAGAVSDRQQQAASASTSSPILSRRRPPPKESDFDIIKLVSNGAYGAVYLVRHRETRQRFALKKLNKSNLMLRNQIDQVYAERDILTFTDNPFVVSFYGSFETKRHLCMVMEYVEGGDCATLLKSIGVMPVEMARLYIAETVLAIEYLHSYGIVHRDLKPDNLLITALGHVKLTDFGLSKIGLMNRTNLLYEGYFDALMTETTQFQDRQICGTPEYIAPEVILRQGYGKPVDWWALGIILYEFLVGTVPFFGETPEELFSHVISDEIEWPEEPYAPPEDAQDLVAGLLQHNPLQRLGTVNGAIELKEHSFFVSLDWNSMLRQKAEFIPQLEGEDDTSYFDTRADRYQHDLDSGDDDSTGVDAEIANISSGGQSSKTSSSLFASFSSSSPRYNLLTEEAKSGSGDSFVELNRSDSFNQSGTSNGSASGLEATSTSPGLATVFSMSLPKANLQLEQESATSPKTVRPTATRIQGGGQKSDSAKFAPAAPSAGISGTERNRKFGVDVSDGEKIQSQQRPTQTGEEVQVKWRHPPNVPPRPIRQPSSMSSEEAGPTRPRSGAMSNSASKSSSNDLPVLKEFTATSKRPQPPPRSTAPKPIPLPSQQLSPKPTPPPRQSMISHQLPSIAALNSGLSAAKSSASVGENQRQHSDVLHVVIPADGGGGHAGAPLSPTFSSGGSSRDGSPTGSNMRRRSSTTVGVVGRALNTRGSQDIAPIINQLKPPIVIRRGVKGFGFTIRAIRVYLGETEYYTIQHLVMAVEMGSPACDAGLRANDLLTHVNGESVQNLTHTDVVQRLMSGGDTITLRVSPLESTSIRQGGPARKSAGKLLKRKANAKQKTQKRGLEKSGKRRASILRRLSGAKRDSFDANAVAGSMTKNGASSDGSASAAAAAAANLTQLAALQRSVSNTDGITSNSSTLKVNGERLVGHQNSRNSIAAVGSSRGSNSSRSGNDSASSIESEMATESTNSGTSLSSRPSSLHGLRSKVSQTLASPSRRKQPSQTMPLSPLARSQPSQQELLAMEEKSGRVSPLLTVTQSTTLLRPIALAPLVQKKSMAKAKNSETSSSAGGGSAEKSSSSIRASSPENRTDRNQAPKFETGGSGGVSNVSAEGLQKKILRLGKGGDRK